MAMFSLTDPPAALREGPTPPAAVPVATCFRPAPGRGRERPVSPLRPDLGDAIRRLLAETRRRVSAGLEVHLGARRLGAVAAGRPPTAREAGHLAACAECTADLADLGGVDREPRGRGG